MMLDKFRRLARVLDRQSRYALDPDQPTDRHGIVAFFEGEVARYVMDGEIRVIMARPHPQLAQVLADGRVVDLWFWDMPDPMAAAFTAQEIYSRRALDWQPGRP